MMKRNLCLFGWIFGVLVAGCLAWTATSPFRRGPTRLTVFVQNIPWRTILLKHRVDATGDPDTLFSPGQPCLYTSLRYGTYTIHVARQDGPDIWVEFLHSDAGRVRTRDIVILPAADQGKVEAR